MHSVEDVEFPHDVSGIWRFEGPIHIWLYLLTSMFGVIWWNSTASSRHLQPLSYIRIRFHEVEESHNRQLMRENRE
jgi:hypothetical protein